MEAEIKAGLEEGKRHQEIFDELKGKYYQQGKLLTDILCKLPIPSRKKKYFMVWMLLLVVLGLLASLRALSCILATSGFDRVVNGFFTAVLVYIIISVARYEKYTFQFVGALGALNIYWIIQRGILTSGGSMAIDGFISLALVVVMCFCAYWLYYKLYVKHKVEKVWVPYMDGSKRLEVQATFMER